MRITSRALAAAIAAAGLLITVGCAKDETVATTQTTTPVTASSRSDEDPTTTAKDADEGEDEDADKEAGAYDEACSIIEEIDDIQSNDVDEAVELMGEARDLSPDELADSWDELIDAMEALGAVQGDEAAEEEVRSELLDDPDFLDAATTIDDFAEDECGLDIALDPNDEREDPDARTGDDEIGIPDARTGDDEIGIPEDGSDETSVRAVKAYMAQNHASEVWWPVLEDASGWSWSNMVDPMWTIKLSTASDWESLTTAELEAACDAVAEHLNEIVETDAGLEILDPDDEVLVSRYERGEPCAPAEGF
jgi:hypothetical protein